MAIIVFTSDPKSLLANIKAAIDQGHIETWSYDRDGDFTHTAGQWKAEAWFNPSLGSDGLYLSLLGRKDVSMSKAIYGIYHGRFSEMLLTHFSYEFSYLYLTAAPDSVE